MRTLDELNELGQFLVLRRPTLRRTISVGRWRYPLYPSDELVRYRKLMSRHQVKLNLLLLPSSLAGVRYVPAENCRDLDLVLSAWGRAFSTFVARVKRSWKKLVAHRWNEIHDDLAVRWQRDRSVAKSSFADWAKAVHVQFQHATYSGPVIGRLRYTYCELNVVSGARIRNVAYQPLDIAIESFLDASFKVAIKRVSAGLNNVLAKRRLFEQVAPELFGRRRYIRYAVEALPVTSWLIWFQLFDDKEMCRWLTPVESQVSALARGSSDPKQRQALLNLCEAIKPVQEHVRAQLLEYVE